MVERKVLPSAKEVWAGIPLPAMAREVVKHSKVHIFVQRMCKGKDIEGNDLFVVETRDIFGMATAFTQANTGNFDSVKDALDFYMKARNNAGLEYQRISKQYEEKGGIESGKYI